METIKTLETNSIQSYENFAAQLQKLKISLEKHSQNMLSIVSKINTKLPQEIKELNERICNYINTLNGKQSKIKKFLKIKMFSSISIPEREIIKLEENLTSLMQNLQDNIDATLQVREDAKPVVALLEKMIIEVNKIKETTKNEKLKSLASIRIQNLLSIKSTLDVMIKNSEHLIETGHWYKSILHQAIQDIKVILGISLVNYSLSNVERVTSDVTKEISAALGNLAISCVHGAKDTTTSLLENAKTAIIAPEVIQEIQKVSKETEEQIKQIAANILKSSEETISKLERLKNG